MVFWIFMLIIVLIVPALMITFGTIFLCRAPDKINCFFGYRTRRSMKNLDTWNFAHGYIARWWIAVGTVLAALVVGVMAFIFGESRSTVSIVGCVLTAIEVIGLIIPVFPTESALKKSFDKNGIRLEKHDKE